MFKFLKEKLKKATSLFSKRIEEEAEEKKEGAKEKEEKVPVREKEFERKKEIEKEKKEKITKVEEEKESIKKREEESWLKETEKEGKKSEIKEIIKKEEPEEEPKKGIFTRVTEKITKKILSDKKFEDLFYDLEIVLMENNVAIGVIEKIKEDLKRRLVDKPLQRIQIQNIIEDTLKESIEDLFNIEKIDLIKKIREKKPCIIVFVGVNGSGKTTTIAKIANLLKQNKLSCILAASDTFRAASIEQLQQHADRLGIRLIKHNYGADPAAVAFDAIAHAKAKNIDCVLIDTAGRMHSNVNLLDEMKKIVRVAKPDLKLFIGEAITGNDCVEQAKRFNEAIGIDGMILAKADVDEKGGAAISVSYVTKKPILYLGTGQKYSDLEPFSPALIIKSLGLEA